MSLSSVQAISQERLLCHQPLPPAPSGHVIWVKDKFVVGYLGFWSHSMLSANHSPLFFLTESSWFWHLLAVVDFQRWPHSVARALVQCDRQHFPAAVESAAPPLAWACPVLCFD